jgi:hypothetical protein
MKFSCIHDHIKRSTFIVNEAILGMISVLMKLEKKITQVNEDLPHFKQMTPINDHYKHDRLIETK